MAAGGIVASFALLYAFGLLIGQPPVGAIFIGAAVTATSVGTTARVLANLGVIERDESRIIVGAAIIIVVVLTTLAVPPSLAVLCRTSMRGEEATTGADAAEVPSAR